MKYTSVRLEWLESALAYPESHSEVLRFRRALTRDMMTVKSWDALDEMMFGGNSNGCY